MTEIATTDFEDVPQDTAEQVDRAIGDRPLGIPNFEGEQVVATKVKITSVAGLEVADRVFRMDESVKLIIEAKVISIEHKPNATGSLERVHLLKAIDSLVINWGIDMDELQAALNT